MKKFKLLSSIAAVAAISCVAAVSSMAADAIDFKVNAAKSTADTKVIEVYYKGDSFSTIRGFNLQISGLNADNVTGSSDFSSCTYGKKNNDLTIKFAGTQDDELSVESKSRLLATLSVSEADTLNVSIVGGSVAGRKVGSESTQAPTMNHKGGLDITDVAAVVKPEDLGVFADGTDAAVKAYKAAADVEGEITWFVTDGTNVATKYVTDVTGGADVVVGLRVAGANVANINYAAVTID